MSVMDKAYIKAVVDGLAAENGGVPPGTRGLAHAGVTKSDWLPYWPRWNDALLEFGYSPNKLTKRYETTKLLDHLAQLALEIRRIPAKSDIRHKSHNDHEFPGYDAFVNLGAKADIVRKLAAYCEGKSGFEEVAQWCNGYTPPISHKSNGFETPTDELEFGFVYLMKSGRFYKIGHSNAAGRREYELAIQLPEKLTTVHVIPTDDPTGIEAYWHNRFKDKRKNGEWFDLTAADVAAFKRRKFM